MALSPCIAQSKRLSLIEAITNTVLGYILAVATQLAVFPYFGLQVGILENLWIGLIFTCVSVLRGYALRRLFNGLTSEG